ncbi:dual specificity protein phosphatase 6 [Nephila pilipes]|uniref:protein-tyrosine-phosphatase n=1 Tax=Nephila pilipes TaxID=299642 RepID=A0A8X6U2Z6_NEPPI|nr:dual specificity protein phosphatase 6 [Nephila pilipes]
MHITPFELNENLVEEGKYILIDCRPISEFTKGHILGAINIPPPHSEDALTIIKDENLDFVSLIKNEKDANDFELNRLTRKIVVYDENSYEISENSVIGAIRYRLIKEMCDAVTLVGGYADFKEHHPNRCGIEPETAVRNPKAPPNLNIKNPSADDSKKIPKQPFPVQVIPYLYLGDAEASKNLDAIKELNITYIMNVTANLPNVFEDKGLGIIYKRIPVNDSPTESIDKYFSEAAAFIGKYHFITYYRILDELFRGKTE